MSGTREGLLSMVAPRVREACQVLSLYVAASLGTTFVGHRKAG